MGSSTDYEAVYESVMRYTRVSARDVDSQDKLARYLRQNDRQNKMTDKLIDRLIETENAKRDIAQAKEEKNFEVVRDRRAASADANESAVREEKARIQREGKNPKGTVTVKKTGERKVLYANSDGKLVYFDKKVNRAREAKVDDKGFVVGGRFAKK
jgi:hypothetical protein